jgi:antitoxin CcdA
LDLHYARDAHKICAHGLPKRDVVSAVFDVSAAKKPTNLSINGDLLAKAKALNINLSATFEAALADLVQDKERENWKRENKAGIQAYNKYVEKHGLFNRDQRKF